MTLHKQDAPTSAGPGHERRDANIRAVLVAGVTVAALVVSALFVVRWTLHHFDKEQPAAETIPPALVESRPSSPTGPTLQVNAPADLARLRAAEDARLNGYGRDPLTGAIHIPIERAMRRVLERGLPVRAAGEANR